MARPDGKLEKARRTYRQHGIRGVVSLTRGYVRTRLGLQPESHRRKQRSLTQSMPLPRHLIGAVRIDEVLAVDWTDPPVRPTRTPRNGPQTFNWVIPPANPGSGGHQNIFRFVSHLERRGHTCRIYIHDPYRFRPAAVHEEMIRDHFVTMSAPISMVDNGMSEADAIFATSWPTAYPVFSDSSAAERFYFVQDFEPLFYPLGTEYVIAENTYRFGFHGITAGGWLSSKLSSDYGMRCDHYDFGADPDHYSLINEGKRNAILFYARPPTPRRAWELGMLALSLFAEANPDIEIHMVGWPLKGFKASFDFVDHGVLRLDELNSLYNQFSGALVLSLTNCSLLPLELLASGCIPVMNDGPNNRMVVDNPLIRYCQLSPHELARELARVCAAPDAGAQAREAAASVEANRWDIACDRVEQVLVEALR